ncbi:MAG: PIG-L family deacetylase [Actinomycetota bacterium]|nr:PIG-L family deacetylase [Actinomycetota bacterium]
MKDPKFEKVLVFFAHPDDGEFMAGGSMARWAAEGKEVVLCVVTNGSHGSNDPSVTREQLIASRIQEQREAAKITGISDIVFLGYEDCYVEDSHDLRRDMIREIRRFKPDVVIGPDPTMYFFADRYVNHPDHRKVGEALCAAVNPGASTVPLYREELYDKGFMPHDIKMFFLGFAQNPNYVIDISEHMETKIKAVSVHYSQAPEWEDIGDRIRQIGRVMAEETGTGYEYAEAFRVLHLEDEEEWSSDQQ